MQQKKSVAFIYVLISSLELSVFLLKLLLSVAALVLFVILVWAINLLFIAPVFDALENMPGPSATLFTSHLAEVGVYTCSVATILIASDNTIR